MHKPKYKIGDVVVYEKEQRRIIKAFYDTKWHYSLSDIVYWVKECDISFKV